MMDEALQTVGPDKPAKRLREYRTSNNLSVAKLAKQLRTSPSNLSQIERGLRRPGLPVATRIRDVVGIGVDDWVASEEEHAA